MDTGSAEARSKETGLRRRQGRTTVRDGRPAFELLLRLPQAQWPRREQILFESARLFAARGYHGTSTRDIADALGIRQPSLYNHYTSKQAILEDLLEYDVAVPAERARDIAAMPGSAAARVYASVKLDMVYCLEAPYDMRAIPDELLDEPGFEAWRRRLRGWYRTLAGMVAEGVEAGEFVEIEPEFARQAIWGVGWEVIRVRHGERRGRRRAGTRPDDTAAFVLRALLTAPDRLDAVRAEADELIAAYRSPAP